MTWVIVDTDFAGRHIMPEDEVEIHFPFDCKCGVYWHEEAQAHVHDAFDGREKFERGERKSS
jgi:hypothetical protein